ncbi:MAG TPA: DUF2867 domain-containing protein [Rhodocyclaceae bacterium]|jgi:hypothetical protein
MTTLPFKSPTPAQSRIAPLIPGSYFHDAWSVSAGDPKLSALGQFLKAFASPPAWVNLCMALRNRAAALVGLKNLGAFDKIDASKRESDYQPGDRVGIFTLIDNTFDEVLLSDRDKHLDVTLSLHRAEDAATGAVVVTVTTVVHVHNLLGRLYMLPVEPMHRLIAPSVLRAVAEAPTV